MQSAKSRVWSRASALAGRTQRRMVEIAVVAILAPVVWSAICDPNTAPIVLLFAAMPVFLTMLAADLWGGAEFWGAWHAEDERLGMHSPINALDHFLVQPLELRIKRRRKQEPAPLRRGLFIPKEFSQRGAIGRDISIRRASRASKVRRTQGCATHKKDDGGGSSEDDGDGGGKGEPPYQVPAGTPDQQSFFSFQSAARILDCSPKTLRNKVSAGKIPAPIQTAVGPRFTADILQAIIHPPIPVIVPPARPRGRPRISASNGKGGAG